MVNKVLDTFWLGRFVRVPVAVNYADPRDGLRAQVVGYELGVDCPFMVTLRYSDGTHRLVTAAACSLDPDQTTAVWPPPTEPCSAPTTA